MLDPPPQMEPVSRTPKTPSLLWHRIDTSDPLGTLSQEHASKGLVEPHVEPHGYLVANISANLCPGSGGEGTPGLFPVRLAMFAGGGERPAPLIVPSTVSTVTQRSLPSYRYFYLAIETPWHRGHHASV